MLTSCTVCSTHRTLILLQVLELLTWHANSQMSPSDLSLSVRTEHEVSLLTAADMTISALRGLTESPHFIFIGTLAAPNIPCLRCFLVKVKYILREQEFGLSDDELWH